MPPKLSSFVEICLAVCAYELKFYEDFSYFLQNANSLTNKHTKLKEYLT
ncbi:hypothetical protein J500_3099 [Acinetobacter sp. 479375]|nr:hypothetical protein J500_3099 [Acinetobacter sp. 479375]